MPGTRYACASRVVRLSVGFGAAVLVERLLKRHAFDARRIAPGDAQRGVALWVGTDDPGIDDGICLQRELLFADGAFHDFHGTHLGFLILFKFKECLDKAFGIKQRQVIDRFARADIADGPLDILGDGDGNAAFAGAI